MSLRQPVRKAIRPKCEGCGGDGDMMEVIDGELIAVDKYDLLYETSEGDCSTCSGKGYVEELEFGCEVVADVKETDKKDFVYFDHSDVSGRLLLKDISKDYSFVAYAEIKENLGKPLTLQEVLLAFQKNGYIFNGYSTSPVGFVFDSKDTANAGNVICEIPLTLPPEQYPQELQDKIMELL